MVWRPLYPGEVVENLKALAGASARDAEAAGAQVFEHSAKVDLRQSELAGTGIERRSWGTQAGRIKAGIERTERRAIAAVSKADFIDFAVAESGKQAGGYQLHPRRRSLRKLWQTRARTEAQASEREKSAGCEQRHTVP